MRNWSIGDKLTAIGIIVAILIGISAFFVPEFRQYIGIENQKNKNATSNDSSNVSESPTPSRTVKLTPTVTPTPTDTPKSEPTSITTKDFVFNLVSCRSLGDKIVCNFTIKNELARMRTVRFYSKRFDSYNTIILDERNRSLTQESIKIANSETKSDWATALISSEGITDGEIVFLKEKETEGKILTLVRLGFDVEKEGDGFNVEFNNVAVK